MIVPNIVHNKLKKSYEEICSSYEHAHFINKNLQEKLVLLTEDRDDLKTEIASVKNLLKGNNMASELAKLKCELDNLKVQHENLKKHKDSEAEILRKELSIDSAVLEKKKDNFKNEVKREAAIIVNKEMKELTKDCMDTIKDMKKTTIVK